MKYVLLMCALSLMIFGCNGGSSNTAPTTDAPITDTSTPNDILPTPMKRSYAEGVGGGVATSSSYRMSFAFGGPPTGERASSASIRLNPTE
jgi:hypothetical protein